MNKVRTESSGDSQELLTQSLEKLAIENQLLHRKVRIYKKRFNEFLLTADAEPAELAEAEITKALYRIEREVIRKSGRETMEECEPWEVGALESEIRRAKRRLIRDNLRDLRELIDRLESRIKKSRGTPLWMNSLPDKVYVLLNDIRDHSMDPEESRMLERKREWYFRGKHNDKMISAPYVLYKPDYDRLRRKMKINYVMITRYLNRLCQVLPNTKKLGKEGRHGQAIYSVGWYSGYRRVWFFSSKYVNVLKAFKIN